MAKKKKLKDQGVSTTLKRERPHPFSDTRETAVGWEPTPEGFRAYNLGLELPYWAYGGDPDDVITQADAMRVSALWRAGNLISHVIGTLSLNAYRNRTEKLDTPRILEKPEADYPYTSTISRMVWSLLLSGNLYALVDREVTVDPQVDQLLVLDPATIRVERDSLGRLHYRLPDNSELPREDIYRTLLTAVPGRDTGIGVIESFGTSGLAMQRAITRYIASLVGDSAVPSILLKSQNPDLTMAEAAEAKQGFVKQFSGKREPAVLVAMDAEPLAWNPESMQMVQLWQQSIREVSLMTGVPPAYLATDVGSSLLYQTTESNRSDLVSFCLSAYGSRIEELLSELLPRGQTARFNWDSLLRPDTATRFGIYEANARIAQITGQPVYTSDEVRELERREPLPEPDPIAPPAPPLALVPPEEAERA